MGSVARLRSRPARALGSVRELAVDWGLTERLEKAAALGPAFLEMLDCGVEISRRAKTLAGVAYSEERRIVLNVALLEQGRESDRDATFLHECAHILADLFHGRPCKHSAAWREIMKLLGEKPAVRHDLSYLSRAAHAVVTSIILCAVRAGAPVVAIAAPVARSAAGCVFYPVNNGSYRTRREQGAGRVAPGSVEVRSCHGAT